MAVGNIGLCIGLAAGVGGLGAIVPSLNWKLHIAGEGALGVQTVHETSDAVGKGGGMMGKARKITADGHSFLSETKHVRDLASGQC